MPPSGVDLYEHEKILTYEELILIIKAAAQLGVSSIRLTGGEPLIRRGLIPFIKVVSAIEGIDDIAITTNGVLLGEMAEDLKNAGVNRLNISLDTLKVDKFKEITGTNALYKVLESIEKATQLGFDPVKLNVVLLKEHNVNEILDFVELTKLKPLHIRFIEMMPLGESSENWGKSYISWTDALEIIKKKYTVEESQGPKGKGPAKYYTIPNAMGTFGFINAVSEHFCASCNRIRITSDGYIKTCLFGESEMNLKSICQEGDLEKVKTAIEKCVFDKPQKHHIKDTTTTSRFMSQIGG